MLRAAPALLVHARTILRLGGPLIANNLSSAGMGFADTVMAGRLGGRQLAGLAVGVGFYSLCFFLALGTLMAVSPSVAHAYGAQDSAAVTRYVRQSLWLVLGLSVITVTAMWHAQYVFEIFDIDAEIMPIAVGYNRAVSFGMPAFIGFLALRFASEGLGITRPIMYFAFLGFCANVIGNWLFMFGPFGLPRLGTIGCAIATAISMWLMFISMLLYVRKHRAYRDYDFFGRIDKPSAVVLQRLLRIGAPIAGSLLSEGGLFVVAALLMGSMGAIIAGAHQVALNYAALMFMIPLALHSATMIHVGHSLGRADPVGARLAGWVGIALCSLIMAVSAAFIAVFNEPIAALYTSDLAVREVAVTLLVLAGLFQVSDGLQVGASGALRGFKDTAVPLAITLFAYWLVGFPIAYVLGVRLERGPEFVWIGLIAGLSVAAVLLNIRYRLVSRAAVRSATSAG